MKYPLSTFGNRLALQSGIGELMQDLGQALASGDENLCMLGGGQPAHIPQVDQIWAQRLSEIAADPQQVNRVLGDYQPPGGDAAFRDAVASLFRREFGWPISGENVCITAGGQTAFFLLLNALAGQFDDGTTKKILLPIVPEYIGYADQSTSCELFRGVRPLIERIGDHEFKYSIDFDSLRIDDQIAAICLSRPTNPSSNVIGDEELQRLAELADQHGIPLIVDNAYGDPFPGVIFTDTSPIWNPSMVLTYSLSKLGLPGTRTGIVIADQAVIETISSMNAITSLANNNVGQAIIQPLIESDEILTVSRELIRPFYQQRAAEVQTWLSDVLDDSVPYRIHRSEGAFFIWLWVEGLPITSAELYDRLKRRGVLVISGHYFFFGIDDPSWDHRNECLRISFTAPESVLRKGFAILAEEINQLFATN
ncbi:valine--pyruvate transaminase [Stieleria sp. TO1_6]|uniref:valine--pyruvate transaminase n=1 Tax=Stieleria tagensis TaxID=2956795 RepID=UPI00209B0B4C|nr:valine--pyruvate transaminase [Stieleria tagensis]MCO8122076.1 valine--pyruvate transaminase [Stieleria tagensis]